jgi:hypothetical protein
VKKKRTGGANKELLNRIEINTRSNTQSVQPDIPDVRPIHLSKRKVLTLRRSAITGNPSTSTSGTLTGAAAFSLSLFDPGAEIKNMFQEYRIIQITCDFVPIETVAADATAKNFGTTHTVIDYHNANVPTNISELEQYSSHQVVQTLTRFQRTFTPRLLTRIYGGLTDAFATTSPYLWLSTDYDDAEYYGIKWALGTNVGLGNTPAYSLNATAVIQCRSTL